jgi:hypothetical protein
LLQPGVNAPGTPNRTPVLPVVRDSATAVHQHRAARASAAVAARTGEQLAQLHGTARRALEERHVRQRVANLRTEGMCLLGDAFRAQRHIASARVPALVQP